MREPLTIAAGYDFGSIQVDLDRSLADRVRDLGRMIPDSDLAEDGRELRPHITIWYGLTTADPDLVKRALGGVRTLHATLGETRVFETEDADVVYVSVRSPELEALHAHLRDTLPGIDTHLVYVPHVTVAYVKPGLGAQYAGEQLLNARGTSFDRIVFSPAGDLPDTIIPLGKSYEWTSRYADAIVAASSAHWQEGIESILEHLEGLDVDRVLGLFGEGAEEVQRALEGNEHSGNYGHLGRPGQVGGSRPAIDGLSDRIKKNVEEWRAKTGNTREVMAGRVQSFFNRATPEERRAGQAWYQDAHNEAQRLAGDYGLTSHQAAGVIAALSPLREWSQNKADAQRLLKSLMDGTADPEIAKLLQANVAKAVEIAKGADPRDVLWAGEGGFKVRSFYSNINDPNSREATIDTHMLRILLADNSIQSHGYGAIAGNKGRYDAFRQAIFDVADKEGISPAAVQATVWLRQKAENPNRHEVGGRLKAAAADDQTLSLLLDAIAALFHPDELRTAGGAGSGNFGHEGRPNQIGGSAPGQFTSGLDPRKIGDPYGTGEFFHGGSAEYRHLQQVLREGLKGSHSGEFYADTAKPGTSYVSTSEQNAEEWALDKARQGNEAYASATGDTLYVPLAVLKVEIPKEEIDKIAFDKNFADTAPEREFHGDIKPEWITGVKIGRTVIGSAHAPRNEWRILPPEEIAMYRANASRNTVTLYIPLVFAPTPLRTAGSAKSGNYGHRGRKGKVGGSAPGQDFFEEAKNILSDTYGKSDPNAGLSLGDLKVEAKAKEVVVEQLAESFPGDLVSSLRKMVDKHIEGKDPLDSLLKNVRGELTGDDLAEFDSAVATLDKARDIRKNAPLVFYHGSAADVIASVKAKGLIPGGSAGADEWARTQMVELGNMLDRPKAIYLADDADHAVRYAELAAHVRGGKPVLFEAKIPRAWAKEHLSTDEEDYLATKVDTVIPPEFVTRVGEFKDTKTKIEWTPFGIETPKRKGDVHWRPLAAGDVTLYAVVMLADPSMRAAGNEHSGNYGHAGRPHQIGGSAPRGIWSATEIKPDAHGVIHDPTSVDLQRMPGHEQHRFLFDPDTDRFVMGLRDTMTGPMHAEMVEENAPRVFDRQVRGSLSGPRNGDAGHLSFEYHDITDRENRPDDFLKAVEYFIHEGGATRETTVVGLERILNVQDGTPLGEAFPEFFHGHKAAGGAGSGFHGHKGRPGEIGGSSPGFVDVATRTSAMLLSPSEHFDLMDVRSRRFLWKPDGTIALGEDTIRHDIIGKLHQEESHAEALVNAGVTDPADYDQFYLRGRMGAVPADKLSGIYIYYAGPGGERDLPTFQDHVNSFLEQMVSNGALPSTEVMGPTDMAPGYHYRSTLGEIWPHLFPHAHTRAAGSSKSGNYGHRGRPGQVGGSTSFLHGTNLENLQRILKEGIVGNPPSHVHTTEIKKLPLALKGHVYLTKDLAEAREYAVSAALDTEPIVVDPVFAESYGSMTPANPPDVKPDNGQIPFYLGGTKVTGAAVLTVQVPAGTRLTVDKRSDILTESSDLTRTISKVARSYKGDIPPEWIKSISYSTVDLITTKETWHTVTREHFVAPTGYSYHRGLAGSELYYIPIVLKLEADPAMRSAGGAGSGNFGHAGRPQHVGGSAPSGGAAALASQATALSRTSKGVADTSSSKDKPGLAAEGQQLVDRVENNTLAAAALAYSTEAVKSPEQLQTFIENINRTLNNGLTDKLYREHEITAYSATLVAELQKGMQSFSRELFDRLKSGDDPVGTAAWVEHQFNSRLHPFADAVGRTTLLLSNWTLQRAGHSLPVYPDREQYFDKATKDLATFTDYYRTLFPPRTLGGAGSGNFGHAGRPGEVGGSKFNDVYSPDRDVRIPVPPKLNGRPEKAPDGAPTIAHVVHEDFDISKMTRRRFAFRPKDNILIIGDADGYTLTTGDGNKAAEYTHADMIDAAEGYQVSPDEFDSFLLRGFIGTQDRHFRIPSGPREAPSGRIQIYNKNLTGLDQPTYDDATAALISKLIAYGHVTSGTKLERSGSGEEFGKPITNTEFGYLTSPRKRQRAAGGAGSGNFSHKGRPGHVGGSEAHDAIGFVRHGNVTAKDLGDRSAFSATHYAIFGPASDEATPFQRFRYRGGIISWDSTPEPDDYFKAEDWVAEHGWPVKGHRLWGERTFMHPPMPIAAGGQGSGNFGHAGRPNEIGGSAPSGANATTNYTPEQVHAINMYQGSAEPDPEDLYLSGGFNDLLRGQPQIDWLHGEPKEITPTSAQLRYYHRQIDLLQSAIERTVTEKDQVFYRGVTAELVPMLKEGTVFVDKGFTSLSADKTIASERFSGFSRLDDLNPGNEGRVYEVHVPKGTPLLDMDSVLNPNNDPDYTTEREHLLGHGTRFQIRGNVMKVLP